jgi:hypothetical protein
LLELKTEVKKAPSVLTSTWDVMALMPVVMPGMEVQLYPPDIRCNFFQTTLEWEDLEGLETKVSHDVSLASRITC